MHYIEEVDFAVNVRTDSVHHPAGVGVEPQVNKFGFKNPCVGVDEFQMVQKQPKAWFLTEAQQPHTNEPT